MRKNVYSEEKYAMLSRCAAAMLICCFTACHAKAAIKVTIENLAPADGTYLTSVWIGFHDGNFDFVDLGVPATTALERLAEDGNAAALSTAFLASGFGVTDASVPGPGGPLAPGDIAMIVLNIDGSLSTSRYFSYASMVIPSNDAFIANGNSLAHQIFDGAGNFLGAEIVILGTAVRDAGTEVNDEVPANTAFLEQMVPNTGVTENGVVQGHTGFNPGGNILTAFPGADFTAPGYQVARITLEQIDGVIPEATSIVTWGILALVFAVFRQTRRTFSR